LINGLTKGLIIRGEHCQKILDGLKTYEMRSRQTNFRGKIGLIVSGTKKIFGTANLYDVGKETIIDAEDWHNRYPLHQCREYMPQWPCIWMLKDVVKFDEPIPYAHKNGCVTWVNL